MMITRSPGATRRAAAPLIPMTPEPRGPGITYVSSRGPRAARRYAGAQRRGQRAGGDSVLGVEVAVAAGQGHAVVLPDGGHGRNLDVEVEVAHQLPDERQLLVVLLAEIGHLMGRQVQ